MKLLVPVVALAAMLAVCAGAAAPARATASADTPQSIARQILGHRPHGLAAVVVDRGYMRVANDANYSPFSSIDPATEKLVGFDVDYARAVARSLGLRIRFRNPAWGWVSRGLVSARYFEVSIGGLKNTAKHRRTLAFTRPYYHLAARVLVRKGGPQVTGVESLAGRSVAATSGTYLRFLARSTDADAVVFKSSADAEHAVRHGDVPMWLLSAVLARRLAAGDDRLEVTGPALFWDRCAVAVRRGEGDLIALLDHAVAALKEDGTTQALLDKWFGAGSPDIRP